jgi:hypothetical protein
MLNNLCPEWESNPQLFRDTILSRARIPVPPSGRIYRCNGRRARPEDLEATAGIEPAHKSFADSRLTTCLRGLTHSTPQCAAGFSRRRQFRNQQRESFSF